MADMLKAAIARVARQQADEERYRLLREAVVAGIAPFQADPAVVWFDDGFLSAGRMLVVEIKSLKMVFKVAIDEQFLYDDHELFGQKIAEEIFKQIRNRPTATVDDHIILGEE